MMQTIPPKVTIAAISENSILISWPDNVCEQQQIGILACQQTIQKALANSYINSIVSYASLLIYYDEQQLSNFQIKVIIEQALISSTHKQILAKVPPVQTVDIPVYYGDEVALDLSLLSAQLNLSSEKIIQLHCQDSYRAYAQGFTPGFCYLATLPKQLQVARHSSPRSIVPKGSVAIAGQQTAIYPNKSPGGWHIIGKTPLAMYSIKNDDPVDFSPAISIGQKVKFHAISRHEFIELGGTL